MKKFIGGIILMFTISIILGSINLFSESEKFTITSPDFKDGNFMPEKFAHNKYNRHNGGNLSPELNWKNAPEKTKSFALICSDPDAPGGTWYHWVVYNIPGESNGLGEDIPKKQSFKSKYCKFSKNEENPNSIVYQGKSDFGSWGYGGPAPPSGTHRYVFTIYALDTEFDNLGTVDARELLRKIDRSVLDKASITGKYSAVR